MYTSPVFIPIPLSNGYGHVRNLLINSSVKMTQLDPQKLLIGAHTSAAGGAHNALLEGRDIGATTIQLFTANQRQWTPKSLTDEAIDLWNATLQETGLKKIMSHDSYLINLCAPDPENLRKSRAAFREEILRCKALGITFLNFHPGSYIKDDPQECMDRIIESILECEALLADSPTRILFENVAGQGSNLGHTFEQIGYMLSGVKNKVRAGVCIDTCHTFAAGYDIRTATGWDTTLKEFDKHVGLEHLQAFHVNDSMMGLGSRRDRHAPLGKGEIGIECFKVLMTDPRTREIPKYLETPDGPELWKTEIQLLREFAAHGHSTKAKAK